MVPGASVGGCGLASTTLTSPTISSLASLSSTASIPSSAAVSSDGCHLRLILASESRKGLIEAGVGCEGGAAPGFDGHGSDCHLLGCQEDVVGGFEDTFVGGRSELFVTDVSPDADWQGHGPDCQSSSSTAAPGEFRYFFANIIDYLKSELAGKSHHRPS